jgi:hypothetical protein
MVMYERTKNLPWNLDQIRFLYPPDDFTGSFANAKMQERHKANQEVKIKALLDHLEAQSDPLEAMLGLHPSDHLRFLHNNLQLFKKSGRLERTLLLLYYKKNTPFALVGTYDEWKGLFLHCDRERLRAEGKPCPFASATAYRGSMTGSRLGLSWTVNRDEVQWFLNRWQDKDLGGGTIFALEIVSADVLFYKEDGHRREVILDPAIVEGREARIIDSLP